MMLLFRVLQGLALLAGVVGLAACSKEPAASRTMELTQDAARMAGPERRIALVVGNSRYESSPLANPANDAQLITTTLQSLGFEVQLLKDADQRAMKRGIQAFGASLEAAGPASLD